MEGTGALNRDQEVPASKVSKRPHRLSKSPPNFVGVGIDDHALGAPRPQRGENQSLEEEGIE